MINNINKKKKNILKKMGRRPDLDQAIADVESQMKELEPAVARFKELESARDGFIKAKRLGWGIPINNERGKDQRSLDF